MSFVIAGQNTCQSGLDRGRSTGSHQRGVAVRKLQHLCDALSRCNFQVRDTYEVTPGHCHDGFEFWTENGAAQHRHGAFAVNYSRDAQFVVGIASLAEPAHGRAAGRRARSRRKLARCEGRRHHCGGSPQESTPIP